MKFKLCLMAVLTAFICVPCLAQIDTTGLAGSGSWGLVATDALKLVCSVVAIWETVVRIFPTAKDITVVGNVFKALTWVSNLLNTKKGGGTHV